MAVPVCNATERAEKAYRLAEELFLAGKILDAHRKAKQAKRLCPTLPGVDNALAAYEVHANAADGGGWRAILGIVGPGAANTNAADAATQDAVKKQFRRLSLLVHPDKAHCCAAAESAFRLLRAAHDEALTPPPPPPPPAPSSCSGGPADRRDMMMRQPPEPGPREPTLIYCPSCETEFRGMVGRRERRDGMRCARCPAWLHAPWPRKPPTEKKPPAAPGRLVFQCPAKCPGCGERYTSTVCVGRWCLQCKACSVAAMVDVHGPDDATASVKRRTNRSSVLPSYSTGDATTFRACNDLQPFIIHR